jgi:hypothetical protein
VVKVLHARKLQRLFATVSCDGLKTIQVQDLRECLEALGDPEKEACVLVGPEERQCARQLSIFPA